MIHSIGVLDAKSFLDVGLDIGLVKLLCLGAEYGTAGIRSWRYARMNDRMYGNRLSRERKRKRKGSWEKFSLRKGGFLPARFRFHWFQGLSGAKFAVKERVRRKFWKAQRAKLKKKLGEGWRV
jgi:hypothetical protein